MSGDRPAVTVGPPLVIAVALVTAVVVGTSWLAPLVPVDRGEGWQLVQKGLGVNAARSVPSWWMVVLFAIAALACHAQAVTSWAVGARHRVVATAWWVIGVGMAWISVDHALALHESAPSLAAGLPGLLGAQPVEAALALVLVPAGLVVLVGGTWPQRLLLPVAAALYAAGQVAVGGGFVDVGLSPHRTSVVEVALQLSGAVLVLAAASSTRRAR